MIKRNIRLLIIAILLPVFVSAKKGSDKWEKSVLATIKKDIDTLCGENMEGRLTGSDGEQLAANYIESRFKQIGLSPYKEKYQSAFSSISRTQLIKNAYFKLFDKNLILNSEVLFMEYGLGNSMSGFAYPEVYEQGNVWLVSLKAMKTFENVNPQKSMYEFAKQAVLQKATGVIFLNDIDAMIDLSPTNLGKFDPINIPVAFITYNAYNHFIKPNLKKDWIEFDSKIGYEQAKSDGKNAMGYLDNNAEFTIVIGAHYDHIGNIGGKYPGANSVSGVASLLFLASELQKAEFSKYNYLFIAFSGKEQNLLGSKTFVNQNDTSLNSINCMLNIDMIGGVSPKNRNLYISGVNTSASWLPFLNQANTSNLKLNIDSSGYGFSDYTSFYTKNIPVLNFSMGCGIDYLTTNDKPTVVSHNSILEVSNYVFNSIKEINSQTKLSFNKTFDILPEIQKLKVDVGILPDFSFNENGIRIDGCIPYKLANKSGLQAGDIITKIGEFIIIDFDDYIEAIKKSNKEKETAITVNRGGVEFKFFMLMKE
jgi:aminopeptidase YwaD